METAEIVASLRETLGARLTAYIGSVKSTREVADWASGKTEPSAETVERLKLALNVSKIITRRDSKEVAQAWFQGMNPQLDDTAPAQLIREGILTNTRGLVTNAALHHSFNG